MIIGFEELCFVIPVVLYFMIVLLVDAAYLFQCRTLGLRLSDVDFESDPDSVYYYYLTIAVQLDRLSGVIA